MGETESFCTSRLSAKRNFFPLVQVFADTLLDPQPAQGLAPRAEAQPERIERLDRAVVGRDDKSLAGIDDLRQQLVGNRPTPVVRAAGAIERQFALVGRSWRQQGKGAQNRVADVSGGIGEHAIDVQVTPVARRMQEILDAARSHHAEMGLDGVPFQVVQRDSSSATPSPGFNPSMYSETTGPKTVSRTLSEMGSAPRT
jgi:hypothetical protein